MNISLVLLWSYSICAYWPVTPDVADDFTHLMNIGKAHLENRESTKAIDAFESASRLRPHSAPAWRNLARAYLLARLPEKALPALASVRSVEVESASTAYLNGLTFARLGKNEDAVSQFEIAVRLDPRTPALRFQLANAYIASGKREKAEEQFRETVRLDPLHAAAHYKLANHAKESGRQTEHQERVREFTRLRKLLGDEARSPEALEACIHTRPEGPEVAIGAEVGPVDVRFADATAEAFISPGDRQGVTACLVDMDATGRYAVFLLDAKGNSFLLRFSEQGRFERESAGASFSEGHGFAECIAGDYHNDVPQDAKYDPEVHALNDLFLIGPSGARLLKRKAPNTFEDVTQTAGLASVSGHRAAWVDYEHDGNVDLAVVGQTGVELWQNNGDGRFVGVTAAVGLLESGSGVDVAAADLENNVAVDLVFARSSSPTLVFQNQREGRFARMTEPPGPWPAARRVLLDDLDNDGFVDAALVGEEVVEIIGSRSTRHERLEFRGTICSSGTVLDFDNDGRLDIAIVGHRASDLNTGVVRLWRNGPGGAWTEVTESAGFAPLPGRILQILAADFDGDADSDILLVGSDAALRYLRNDGGHRNGQLKLRLQGTKTNPMGIGTHVELRAGDHWITRTVQGLPVELGLAGQKKLDSLQTIWTNGVVENRIAFEPGPKPLSIVEKNVAAGSCPFLYAWDGKRFRFVTDLLGNSPVGLPLRRNTLLSADPDEIVWVGDDRNVAMRDGKYLVEITSEFREVLYLDEVRLLAVDHPHTSEVHSTDKLMPPPFPDSELWNLVPAAPLRQAMGSDGIDRTAALRAIDGQFAEPGTPLPPPYRGMCQPLALTLEFDEVKDSEPLVLALTGWLQYGDGSTNIALSQDSSVQVISPVLEAETEGSGWRTVEVVVGMPAGKTKTILCDLTERLPHGTRRLRLTTSFEIRWDRIALMQKLPGETVTVREIAPSAATLRWRGFSELKSRASGHPTTPDHAVVFDRPPWRTTPQGWCTRYGDVSDLVLRRDGAIVLVNGGDAVQIEFASKLPPAPQNGSREFFLYSVGWDKDADHNVVDGETVEPLPIELRGRFPAAVDSKSTGAAQAEDDWGLRYNTRWVPGDRFAPR